MWISLAIALISVGVVAMIMMDKTRLLRAGGLHMRGEALYPHIEPHVRRIVRATDSLLVYISRTAVYIVLVALKRFTPWFHRWSGAFEKRLLHIIAVIKGRGIIRERGAASLFLSDLMQHKERIGKKRPTF